jgi:hypothetical protein
MSGGKAGVLMGRDVVEYRTKLEVESFLMREAYLAVEQNYDEANVAALHPMTWELVEMLRKEL